MKKFLEKYSLHKVYWVSASLLLLLSVITYRLEEPLIIQFRPEPFYAHLFIFGLFFTFIFAIIGLGHWILKKFNKRFYYWAFVLHFNVTLLVIIISSLVGTINHYAPRRYFSFGENIFSLSYKFSTCILPIVIGITLYLQLFYMLLIIANLFRKSD